MKKIAFFLLLTTAGWRTSVAQQVTPTAILEKYFAATGGLPAWQKVKSLSLNYVSVKGSMMEMSMESKLMGPNLSSLQISMNGNVMLKQAFNGKHGYITQNGKTVDFTQDVDAFMQNRFSIATQRSYLNKQYKMEVLSNTTVRGKTAYTLKIIDPLGSIVTEYYDVETGLLVKRSNHAKNGSDEVFEFGDYKKYKNILIPTKMISPLQGTGKDPSGTDRTVNIDLVLHLEDARIDEGVTAGDFK
ncbi:MAG: hypothetical protein J0H74_29475 [Chitinophagaceae bacterium]|nr:hypothetical protein [Chitinophagaceae bacterium]